VIDPKAYGFFEAFAAESAFRALSAFMAESILCADVSIVAGAGAGAIVGAAVSVLGVSDFAQAVIARTAATKARRFITVS